MSKIAIITDSNSGISQMQGQDMGIQVIPMPFTCKDETLFEDVSITQPEFYSMLKNDVNVSTSQPAIGQVVELWDKLLEEFDEIIQIPMSSGLSMSCDTATAFASEKPYEGRVHVVNNLRVSVTQRQAVLDAIKLAEKGLSGAEIKNILEEDKLNASIYIVVDTLKYLKKGGRITPAAATLGSLLGIKPILQIQGAKLDAFKKTRAIKAAKKIMIDQAKADIANRFGGDNSKIHVCVVHSNNLEEANLFMGEVKKEIPEALDYHVDRLSLSVACHIGPGSLAIAIIKDLEA